ncbi:MAG: triose-phosphate isomerase [Parcubacteria group bacterium]|jgi:triosephosphate isomerase
MKNLIVANLKMNLINSQERDRYLELITKELKNKKFKNTEIVLCPPYVHLEAFQKSCKKGLRIGAQDMFSESKGSYTGEISPVMLKNYGCDFVILGHSDRRRYFSENNHEINLKIIAALKNGLEPILCVGENRGQRAETIIKEQLKNCLKGINRSKMEKVTICYEPVWAISSNNPDHVPTTNEIMSAKLIIKKFLVENFGLKVAERVRIIYGGSVDSINVNETCINSGMSGALVGKESLTPHRFVNVAKIMDNCN